MKIERRIVGLVLLVEINRHIDPDPDEFVDAGVRYYAAEDEDRPKRRVVH